jgi:localization factor PodJL
MRAELPWNVAGIPPEAREAARAAARREGLSVGEWLTRRILRSFSEMGEESTPMSFDRSTYERPTLDPWGLPLSAASRRDTEDMLARVSRSEAESSDSYRRIEDQLRNVGRRLDSAERSQSENNRAMSKAASEINIASREQAQAFDQLGGHVLVLSERLERLERNAAQDGLKDAVKGLHQGLSRLADQIGQTASQSAMQVSSLAGSLEQLATRLGQARTDAENATKALEARVIAVESSVQFSAERLDHALEKIESQTAARAHDLTELQKRETNYQNSLERVEERIARLETKGSDPAMDRRLDNIERALAGIVSRLEQSDPSAALADTLRQVNQRLNAVEKNHGELLAELRASLARAPEAVQAAPVPDFDPTPQAPRSETPPFIPEPVTPDPELAQPLLEAAPEPDAFAAAPHAFAPDAFAPDTFASDTFASDTFVSDTFASDAFAPDAFAPGSLAQDAFANNFDMPQGLADALAEPALGDDNFLSAARRSARAASDAEFQSGGHGFSWSHPASDSKEKSSPRYLVVLVIAFIALLAIAVGMMLSQRLRSQNSAPQSLPKAVTHRTVAPVVLQSNTPTPGLAAATRLPATQVAPAKQQNITSTPGPSVVKPAAPVAVVAHTTPAVSTRLNTTPKIISPSVAVPSVGAPQTAPPPPARMTPPSTDKVAAAANAGNVIAETIIGFKYLDGQGIAADPTQALKWLQKAADAGQAVARYRLGTMYERGQGVIANPVAAAKWYLASANQGNRKAMHNLAIAFAEGATGKKYMAESARWFSKAAALGLSDSQFNLAVLYERGDGVPQSLIDAFKWYSIAAATGDAESKARLTVLQTQLSDPDRAAATRAAQAFRVAPLNRSANVPPEPADLPSN